MPRHNAEKINQLRKRVITVCILLPFVIAMILYLPNSAFVGLCSGVFVIAAFEWTRLAGFRSQLARVLAMLAIPLFFMLFLILIRFFVKDEFLFYSIEKTLGGKLYHSPMLEHFLLTFVFASWTLALLAVIWFPKGSKKYAEGWPAIVIGTFVLVPPFIALIALQRVNPSLVLYPLILIWVADIAAYFSGRAFGKHKLAPRVSAGKTWEGVLGAIIGSLVVAGFGYHYLHIKIALGLWLTFNMVVVLFSIVGDLFESIFKRMQNLKDSSNLLPGHGGLLDRIDSLTAALPIFAVGLMAFS
jgi:phosphatidate cytidylyltransferase